MNILVIAIVILAIVLFILYGFNTALSALLYIAIVLLVIAAIVFLLRFITGKRTH